MYFLTQQLLNRQSDECQALAVVGEEELRRCCFKCRRTLVGPQLACPTRVHLKSDQSPTTSRPWSPGSGRTSSDYGRVCYQGGSTMVGQVVGLW